MYPLGLLISPYGASLLDYYMTRDLVPPLNASMSLVSTICTLGVEPFPPASSFDCTFFKSSFLFFSRREDFSLVGVILLWRGVVLKVRSPPCLAEKDCFKSVPGASWGRIEDFYRKELVTTTELLQSVFCKEIVPPLNILPPCTTGIFFIKSGWGRLLKEYLRNSIVFFYSIYYFICTSANTFLFLWINR